VHQQTDPVTGLDALGQKHVSGLIGAPVKFEKGHLLILEHQCRPMGRNKRASCEYVSNYHVMTSSTGL
jgi:hypothetical protein